MCGITLFLFSSIATYANSDFWVWPVSFVFLFFFIIYLFLSVRPHKSNVNNKLFAIRKELGVLFMKRECIRGLIFKIDDIDSIVDIDLVKIFTRIMNVRYFYTADPLDETDTLVCLFLNKMSQYLRANQVLEETELDALLAFITAINEGFSVNTFSPLIKKSYLEFSHIAREVLTNELGEKGGIKNEAEGYMKKINKSLEKL